MSVDYESNRLGCSFVAFCALIGCLMGSWIAFGVFVATTVEYIATMVCEVVDRRPS